MSCVWVSAASARQVARAPSSRAWSSSAESTRKPARRSVSSSSPAGRRETGAQRGRGRPRQEGGLAGERLDQQDLVAARDVGEDGVAGERHGQGSAAAAGARAMRVMLWTRTPPFWYGAVRRSTRTSRRPAAATAAR